ncbi:MAG: hypothetical protein ABIX46_06280, partial [Burkholderiaceae bacterium]
RHRRGWLPLGIGSVFGYVVLLAVAAVLVWLMPRFSARATEAVASAPWRVLGLGLLLVVTVPLVVILLVLTLLGIPLALAVLAFYPLLMMVGFAIGAVFVGERLSRSLRAGAPLTPASRFGYTALGLLLLMLLGWLPVVGWLLLTAVTLAGLGAIVLALVRGRSVPAPA